MRTYLNPHTAFDCDTVFFKTELLLTPPPPFTVVWPGRPLVDGIAGTLIKIPALNRIWKLTGAFDRKHKGWEGRWPD